MECCSYRKARNAAGARDDFAAFAHECIVEKLCDACTFSAMEDIFELSGKDRGEGRVSCLDVIALNRPDLMTFAWKSPSHPDEAPFDLYLTWALESKVPALVRWLLRRKPRSCRLTNKEMAEIVADTNYVDNDVDSMPDVRGCLEVLAEFMHVPTTNDALDAAASCGNTRFFEWIFENKPEHLWKRRHITDTAFFAGHLTLCRLLIKRGVPFLPHEMKFSDIVQTQFETKKQYRKRKFFVIICRAIYSDSSVNS